MKRRAVLLGAALALVVGPQLARAAQTCAEPSNCIEVSLGSAAGTVNQVISVPLTFRAAPDNGQSGGPDEVAAIALSVRLAPADDAGTPLLLADCNDSNQDGTPDAVKPDGALSNFKVVVENAYCSETRQHCLCPAGGSGITADNFINLVVYGPNPLPPPGAGVEIPTLPAGPQTLLTMDLRPTAAAVASSPIALHIFNEVADTQPPQFRAKLSVGDKLAVDQTCVPQAGTPPCSGEAVSQVVATDGSVAVNPALCIGDLDDSGSIEAGEVVKTLLAFGQDDVSINPRADGDNSGSVEAGEVVRVLNNFAQDECNP